MRNNIALNSKKHESETVELLINFIHHFTNNSAAIVLSVIQYWYKEGKNGKPKLKVVRKGMYWLVKSSADMRKETGLSIRSIDAAIKELLSQGIIEVEVHRFNGTPMRHIRILEAEGKGSIDHDFTLPHQYSKANLSCVTK